MINIVKFYTNPELIGNHNDDVRHSSSFNVFRKY